MGTAAAIVMLCAWPIAASGATPMTAAEAKAADKRVFDATCAACHGFDGKGRAQSQVGFDTPLPDFTDCSYASREADADWFGVIHEGGRLRVFSQMMPAFGGALTAEEINAALRHIRSFCVDKRWTPGEFNLPRPLFTEKAFPEDEAVVTVNADAEGGGAVRTAFIWEKRFGPNSQVEVSIPIAAANNGPPRNWLAGLGDIVLAVKHNAYFNTDRGSIVSIGAEASLPTGSQKRGLGSGKTVFEPFVAYGQLLPDDAFLQVHALGEIPVSGGGPSELGFRTAIGKTWATGGYGRSWTPMVELLLTRELEKGSYTEVDVAPSLQVSLSTRRHILASFGARIPINKPSLRNTQLGFYFIWDWYDGGLFEAW